MPCEARAMRDGQGLEVSNAGADAVAALDFLNEEWLRYGNRLAQFIATADHDERSPMLKLMAACLTLSLDAPDGEAAGRRYLEKAKTMPGANAREKAWIVAVEAWVQRDIDRALELHLAMAAEWPRDLMSVKIGQLHAFNIGNNEALLEIAEVVLPFNQSNHYIWGMRAFGLEQCHRIDEAEASARKAVAMRREDPWAHHAVAHCLETRGRLVDGVAWMRSMSDTWDACNSFMQTHNWWHLALFLIDLDRTDEALELFDERVWGVWKEFCQDQVNAVSLLARLELRGVDVGGRWADVAQYLKPRLHEHYSPFLDLHYLYGLARAGEQGATTEMLASLEDRAERAKPFERTAWAEAGVPAAHGLAAHAKGDYPEAARLLGQALPHLQTIGGSHAQRALFEAIHLDSLVRANWNDRALAVLQAGDRLRPTVPATKRALAAVHRKLGRAEEALTFDYQADRLAKQYREMKMETAT
jgi:tetratricopeptide (TPR) repeat protein